MVGGERALRGVVGLLTDVPVDVGVLDPHAVHHVQQVLGVHGQHVGGGKHPSVEIDKGSTENRDRFFLAKIKPEMFSLGSAAMS